MINERAASSPQGVLDDLQDLTWAQSGVRRSAASNRDTLAGVARPSSIVISHARAAASRLACSARTAGGARAAARRCSNSRAAEVGCPIKIDSRYLVVLAVSGGQLEPGEGHCSPGSVSLA